MVHRSLIECLVALSVAAVFGCRQTTAPAPTSGSPYVLRSLDGNSLPVLEGDYLTTRYYLVADSLTFYDDGRYAEAIVGRLDSVGTSYSVRQPFTGTGRYTLDRDTIRFVLDCPPNAFCIAPPIGWLAPDGTLTVAQMGSGVPRMVKRFTPSAVVPVF